MLLLLLLLLLLVLVPMPVRVVGLGLGGAVVVCCFALLAHIAIAAHDMRTSLKNASIIMHTD